MKTTTIGHVKSIMIYDSTREVVTVNGTKTYKDGAVVFQEPVEGASACTLTAKELDFLAKQGGIEIKGRVGWNLFAKFVGVNIDKTGARALCNVETYEAGDEYIKADKTVGKHLVSGTNVRVDTIVYEKAVKNAFLMDTLALVRELKNIASGDEDDTVVNTGTTAGM